MNSEEETKLNYEEGSEWHIQKSLNYNIGKYIDIFVKGLKGKKILEIGVGAGRDIQHFKKRGIIVEGIDYSQKFIDHCKKSFPDLKFRLGDIRKIDLSHGLYDGIWAFASLLNMPKNDLKILLPQLRSSLKEGGEIFISVKEGEGEKVISDVAGRRLFSFYKLDELKSLVEESGFKIVFTDKISDYDLTGKNKDKEKPGWIFLLGLKTI
jgi:SAM-dependent methyltransferase|tara:strand:+ start:289 stop:915 length:627 start_codon:yes stop_codon:yes gene_type:complete